MSLQPAELLTLLAPELASVDEGRRNAVIDLAEALTGSAYGASRSHAVALHAAHILTLGNRAGSAGVLIQEREGDLMRAYAQTQSGDDLFKSTGYGQQLLELRGARVFSARTALVM